VGYFLRGRNVNLKTACSRTSLRDRDWLDGFTFQTHLFVY
jgi:hypothetical protein